MSTYVFTTLGSDELARLQKKAIDKAVDAVIEVLHPDGCDDPDHHCECENEALLLLAGSFLAPRTLGMLKKAWARESAA